LLTVANVFIFIKFVSSEAADSQVPKMWI